jgi:hypothetical protein
VPEYGARFIRWPTIPKLSMKVESTTVMCSGQVLSSLAVRNERRCLSHEGSGNKRNKGGVLATKAVEAQGKGGVLATKAVKTQDNGGVLATKAMEAYKAKAVSYRRNPPHQAAVFSCVHSQQDQVASARCERNGCGRQVCGRAPRRGSS